MHWEPGSKGIYIEKGSRIVTLVAIRHTVDMVDCTFRIEAHLKGGRFPDGHEFEASYSRVNNQGLWAFTPLPARAAELILAETRKRAKQEDADCDWPDDPRKYTHKHYMVRGFFERWGIPDGVFRLLPVGLVEALIEEELQILRGDWKGSLYGPTGARWDWYLFLDRDGRYESTERLEPDKSWTNCGAWSFDPAERVLELRPETPGRMGLEEERWRVLSVEDCEDSNVVLVLYRIVLANRNLPILLYRVHDQERGHGTDGAPRRADAAGSLDGPA